MTIKAALFDLDGVLFDTEGQYEQFWQTQGKKYHSPIKNIAVSIKGQTLPQILKNCFSKTELYPQITCDLNEFESQMRFDYIAGAPAFIRQLRAQGIRTAVVTSSNELKMANVYRVWPDFLTMFDVVVTADQITRSKPDPECYCLAAQKLGCANDQCVVFEDSLAGLESARRAEMGIVGLATTHSIEEILHKADIIIRDFNGFTYETFYKCFSL